MNKAEPTVEKFEAMLTLKERELLLQRDGVWRFIDTKHKSKTTKEYQKQVRKSGLELSSILFSLIDLQDADEFKNAAKGLCERCRGLENYTRDMNKILAEDLAERQKEEDKKKIDLIKNLTFFFAIPFGFSTAIKNGVTHGKVDIDQATEFGFAVSATVVFSPSLTKAFTGVARAVCKAPQQIKNSFMLYYARETLKEAAVAGISGVKNGTGLIGQEISKTPARAKTVIKVLSGRKPKL